MGLAEAAHEMRDRVPGPCGGGGGVGGGAGSLHVGGMWILVNSPSSEKYARPPTELAREPQLYVLVKW